MSAPTAIRTYRFGVFELNLSSRQLLKNGRELHLQEQPLRLLVSLLDRPGELLTREELREKLWLTETYLEFDDGLNTAVQKIRQVLGDDARNPRFVETVPRCGYRFIAPVQTRGAALQPDPAPVTAAETYPRRATRSYWPWIAIASAAVSLATGWLLPSAPRHPRRQRRLAGWPDGRVRCRPQRKDDAVDAGHGLTRHSRAARHGRCASAVLVARQQVAGIRGRPQVPQGRSGWRPAAGLGRRHPSHARVVVRRRNHPVRQRRWRPDLSRSGNRRRLRSSHLGRGRRRVLAICDFRNRQVPLFR